MKIFFWYENTKFSIEITSNLNMMVEDALNHDGVTRTR